MAAIAADGAKASAGYRYLVIAILAVVYTLSFIDRQIVAVLAEPIRKEMALSDTQLGALTGLAFAVFYTVCGLPLAWLADRTRRIWIISAACALWSLFTIGCGTAANFLQFALMRIGVGVGEAGGTPPSYSLISDYFRPKERATALAIFSLGVPFGTMLGSGLGGWIAAHEGWRMAFYVAGAPGLVMAVVLLAVVREPARGGLDPLAPGRDSHPPAPPLGAAVAAFLGNRTLMLATLCGALSAFVTYATLSWNVPLLMRVKHMSLVQVAAFYGPMTGACGVAGTLASGWLADWLGRRDVRWHAWIPALAWAVGLPFWIAVLWAPAWQLALGLLVVPMFLNSVRLAPIVTVVQNAAAPAQRGVASAIFAFVGSLVGMGFGPLLVGRISDMVKPTLGEASLTFGMAGVVPVFLAGLVAQLALARCLRRDQERAER